MCKIGGEKKVEKEKWISKALLFAGCMFLHLAFSDMDVQAAGTLYESPYVTFSPDEKAWTFNQELPEGIVNGKPTFWYEDGYTISTGKASGLRSLRRGEHYYAAERRGEVPVGAWEVVHPYSQCIQGGIWEKEFHGISYGITKCGKPYFSGWEPYCADCGQSINSGLIYGSREAVSSVNSINVGLDIYYLCPSCNHLEQARHVEFHTCKQISWNRYQVKYEVNNYRYGIRKYQGNTEPSFHMYNNEPLFEGEDVTASTHLTLNGFQMTGYHFVGWNTKADGSGTFYEDGAEIFNLTTENYDEDAGTGMITLYAQWEKIETNLVIDPNGGRYLGTEENTVLRQEYGTIYTLETEAIVPPDGYTVSFDSNGGGEIAPVKSIYAFEEWSLQLPAGGVLVGEKYGFRGQMDDTDIIKALYIHHPITLPTPEKENASFGGWYRDPECTEPVGNGGDPFTPDEDTVLYAKWAELVLYAKDNYMVGGGKGAVDLSWTQADGKNKTYRLYQSLDGVRFEQIYDAEEATLPKRIDGAYGCSGQTKTVAIPYNGFYTLTASGAQGGNYGSYQGGKGGSVTGKFYLTKGEILTITVGGRDGYNGGGSAASYGMGGGYTLISSDRKGTLLIGGGGGGATSKGNGGNGGEETGLLAQTPSEAGNGGENGGAGGGGGYAGGKAGESTSQTVFDHKHGLGDTYVCGYIAGLCEQGQRGADCSLSKEEGGHDCHIHEHTGSCFGCVSGSYTIPATGDYRIEVWGAAGGSGSNDCIGIGIGGYGGYAKGTLHLTKGTTLTYYIGRKGEDRTGRKMEDGEGSITTIGQAGEATYVKIDGSIVLNATGGAGGWHKCYSYNEWNKGDKWEQGDCGTGAVYAAMSDISAASGANNGEGRLKITYVAEYPAYGGSNYINTRYAVTYSQERGVREGDGAASIITLTAGFQDAQKLEGVSAPDLAAPDAVNIDKIDITDAGENALTVIWQKPKDNGTFYYHKAESYAAETEQPLCVSNITQNMLVSGVDGYYYTVDEKADTKVNAGNAQNSGRLLKKTQLCIRYTEKTQYLHLAAVDAAGNVSETVHVRLNGTDVAWNLFTEALNISSVIAGKEHENIYPAAVGRTWYVRADGGTPFLLSFDSRMEGAARADYQINYQILDSRVAGSGETQRYLTRLPYTVPLASTAALNSAEFVQKTEGASILGDGMYNRAARSSNAKRISFEKAFTLNPALHGESITVVPVAGADYEGETIYSDREKDALNALTIIADGEGPVITGLEAFEGRQIIDRLNQTVVLTVTASDALSGVKAFSLSFFNEDNYGERTYEADENGRIRVEITEEDPLFSGDYIVTARAADNVGNASEQSLAVTEFALETSIERILEPHEPVFKRGESGILYIKTYGYADRVEVEFPEELTALNPELNRTYVYDAPLYVQEEQLQFMIPLYAPENENYTITVRAYKGDKQLEEHPAFGTVEVNGSVLDEIRTRLR